MNIPRARKILSKHGVTDDSATWQDYLDAVKMAIEALKREEDWREDLPANEIALLPGETQD